MSLQNKISISYEKETINNECMKNEIEKNNSENEQNNLVKEKTGFEGEKTNSEIEKTDSETVKPISEKEKMNSNSISVKEKINSGTEKIISEKKGIFCPWIKQDSKCNSLKGLLKFHYEILDFYYFIKLNEEEEQLRVKTYDFIKDIINENFPEYICGLYGSFKTGLSLPNSDIDILILPKEEQRYNTIKKEINKFLNEIYIKLKEKNDFSYIEIIKAKVPIIKCTYKETNIKVDISIFKKNGAAAAEIYEKVLSIYPEIRPLMLTIKYILRQRGLNEIYKGGVSSFIIFSLLFYYINYTRKIIVNSIKNGQKEKLLSLGDLLLGFFNFYGYEFNYKDLKISIRNGCFLKKRDDDNKNILSLENFQDISQDLGKSCYQYSKIIDVFKYACKHLYYIKSPVVSYLSGIIVPDDLLRERAKNYK